MTRFFLAWLSLVALGCGADPAPRFHLAEVTPVRAADGHVDVDVKLQNTAGPQVGVACVRLEWISSDTPARLVEAREQCIAQKLGGGDATALRFALTSKRRVAGDTLAATVRYDGGQFVDPTSTLGAKVPE